MKLFTVFFIIGFLIGQVSAVNYPVNSGADIRPGIIKDVHIASNAAIKPTKLAELDPTGRTINWAPVSDGTGHIVWAAVTLGGPYLPLAGGTMLGDILALNSTVDLGSAFYPFGQIFGDQIIIQPLAGMSNALLISPSASWSSNYITAQNNTGVGPPNWFAVTANGTVGLGSDIFLTDPLGSFARVDIKSGFVDPEGAITANPGSTYHRTTGQYYLKTTGTGNTGWVEIGAGGGGGSGIVGPGTVNQVAKFTPDTTSVGDSQITDNGSSVGINNTSPDTDAILDLTSTTKGLLWPRMTATQRDSIAGLFPTEGMMIFDNDEHLPEYFSQDFDGWLSMAVSGYSSVTAAQADHGQREDIGLHATFSHDETVINQAIGQAGKGCALLRNGTYKIEGEIFLGSGCLEGESAGQVILKRYYDSGSDSGIIRIGASTIDANGVTLKNIILDGNVGTYTNTNNNGIYIPANHSPHFASQIILDNVEIKNGKGDGIITNASERITIHNCYIHDMVGNGIKATGADIRLSDSYLKANGKIGLFIGGGGVGDVISNNVLIGGSTDQVIRDIRGGNVITGNYIDQGTVGIDVDSSPMDVVLPNYNYGDTIVGNIISNSSSGFGIKAKVSATPAVQSVFSITGNSLGNWGAAGGISVTNLSNFNVSGNNISSPSKEGILIDNSSSGVISGNTIYNPSHGNTTTYAGIHLTGNSKNISVTGNNVLRASSEGLAHLLIDSGSDNNLLCANKFGNSGADAETVTDSASGTSTCGITSGTFTLGAAAETTVTDARVTASSIITFTPTNAAAGTLMGSAKSLYISARTAGTSFKIKTADASSAAGTETFVYQIVN